MAKPDIPILINRDGSLPEQVEAIRRHLFLTEERLNYVLSHLDDDNFTPPIWKKLIEGGGGGGTEIALTSVTLTVAGWSSNTQTVSADGVTEDATVIVSPDTTSFYEYAAAAVYCSAQGDGTLTFTCGIVPTTELTVNVMVVGD